MTRQAAVDGPRLRTAVRRLLRDRVLDAATDLAATTGWQDVRMADIASRAGVSRRSVFNEFGSKAALLDAIAWRNTERRLQGVLTRLGEHPDDLAAAVAAAIEFVLTTTAADPLHQKALAGEPGAPDEMLTILTTRSGPFIKVATDFMTAYARQHWPQVNTDDEQLRAAFDTLLRVVASHIVQPADGPIPETARSLGRQAARILTA